MRRGILFILPLIALNLEGGEPRRVLLIHSFGQDFQPFITFSADFRSGLARESPQPVDFFDVALAGARFESQDEGAFVGYVAALFAERRPDLVVPMGAPAVGFAQKYRARLFPDTPMLLAAVDQRLVQSSSLTTNDAVISVRHEPRLLVEAMLQLMPETTNVVLVFGSSPLERFWLNEFMRETHLPTNHVGCESFSGLSFEQMKKRAAALPRGSAMLWADFLVDADGIPQTGDEALANLHAVANAPIFGIHDFQLGHGIVGGPLVPVRELARQTASAAARILKGESPASFRPPPMGASVPTYDWRELRRWKIPKDRLPPGSIIEYRVPTIWERHRFIIVTGVTVVSMQAGLILGLVLSLRDRWKAERSLRHSEEQMKLAASAVGLYLWEWDFATDRVWVKGPLAEPIGANQQSSVEFDHLFRRVHPDDRESVALACKNSREGKSDFDCIHRRLLTDGRIIWVAARGRVEFDGQLKPVRMRGISMDITARKEAEERATESERKFLLMANSAPVLIWASGPDKLCTFLNKARVDFTGRALEQGLDNGWVENVHPEDAAHCFNTYTESFDARLPFTMEYRLRRHDGQYRWVSDRGVPRYDSEKKFLGYIGSCVDVTERKATEQDAQRTKEELAHVSRISVLGELAGSLAHELKQPLTAIVSSGEAAQRFVKSGRNDEEVGEALKDIVEQGQRAGEIIAGICGMLKKDVGQMGPQDINGTIRSVLEMVRSDLAIRGVTATFRLDPHLPPVKGHAVQLQQVVLNLVMNACDAMAGMAPGAARLTIESRRAAAEAVEVSITDSGPGFSKEMLQHVFEPFRTTKAKGLGLGLPICRSIISMHGGRLAAANNHGKGAILRFTLQAQKELHHD